MDSLVGFFQSSPVPPQNMARALWLIIAFPALGALVNGVFGRYLGRANVNLIATAAVAGSFLMSLIAFWVINDRSVVFDLHPAGPIRQALLADYGTWFSVGDFAVRFGLRVDHLSGTLLLIITGVGTLIHLYSTEYMSHDDGYWRYFAYLNLFVAMMLVLVMGDNLLLLFVGWEGVGLCSYLLIGFWYTDPAKAWAGRKAFVTNRIGDFGFLIGTFLLVLMIGAFGRESNPVGNFGNAATASGWEQAVEDRGPLDFQTLELFADSIPFSEETSRGRPGVTLESEISTGPLEGFAYGDVLFAIMLLFLLGAAGKSAQLPLYVWLPDAMAGPTPVSALIHAATMVTAGVYLFVRVSYLLVLSPAAMSFVAIVGALTALFAAVIAFAQDDIKKVLAYSTVSQLGIMFIGVGVGAFWAAVLHLVTHAFFKACLFLGAGSVMHGNGDETDIKKLGGLRRGMRSTWATFAVATVAITGVLPLSGFFSKDAILHAAHATTLKGQGAVPSLVYYLGLIAAACTAFYMARLYVLTFEGKRAANARIPESQVHESRWPMTVPLVVLAALSVAGLFYGIPFFQPSAGANVPWIDRQPVMENFLGPVLRTTKAISAEAGTVVTTHGGLLGSWATAWIVALLAAGAAVFAYTKFFPSRAGQQAPAAARRVLTWTRDKFYVDELYDWVVIKPVKLASFVLYRVMDTLLIDTVAVRGTAWVTARTSSVLRYFQTGDVQSYAAVMALAILGGVAWALLKVLQ